MEKTMKNLLKINLMTLLLLAFCATGTAQDHHQRMSREQLAEKQAKHIAQELAFDEATTQQFVETFCAYQQEMWALGPQHKAEPTNDEEAEQAIKERFERSQQILDLRQKYYKEYSKFLTQSQIQQVYKMERQVMNRLNKHRGHGKPHRPQFEPEE
jgi:Spy/CpxP family protein refolding chaperone